MPGETETAGYHHQVTAAEMAEQFARPAGELGKMVAGLMAAANVETYATAIDVLQGLRDGRLGGREPCILEVGCADGAFVELLWLAVPFARYVGVDHSPLMIAEAIEQNEALVANGRAEFLEGSAHFLPVPDESADLALAINTVRWWPDVDAGLRQILRALRPGGAVVIGSVEAMAPGLLPPEVAAAAPIAYSAEELVGLCQAAGFDRAAHSVEDQLVDAHDGAGPMPRRYALVIAGKAMPTPGEGVL